VDSRDSYRRSLYNTTHYVFLVRPMDFKPPITITITITGLSALSTQHSALNTRQQTQHSARTLSQQMRLMKYVAVPVPMYIWSACDLRAGGLLRKSERYHTGITKAVTYVKRVRAYLLRLYTPVNLIFYFHLFENRSTSTSIRSTLVLKFLYKTSMAIHTGTPNLENEHIWCPRTGHKK
jgi:hypothetical protein